MRLVPTFAHMAKMTGGKSHVSPSLLPHTSDGQGQPQGEACADRGLGGGMRV